MSVWPSRPVEVVKRVNKTDSGSFDVLFKFQAEAQLFFLSFLRFSSTAMQQLLQVCKPMHLFGYTLMNACHTLDDIEPDTEPDLPSATIWDFFV